MNDIFVVPLTNSDQLCIIDVEDAELIMQSNWNLTTGDHGGYVQSSDSTPIKLHRLILKYRGRNHIHHENELKWDCRKINLQILSPSKHAFIHRTKKRNKSTSIYRWVHYAENTGLFQARITKNNTTYNLGLYPTEIDAALIANIHARALWGKGCYQNVITPTTI